MPDGLANDNESVHIPRKYECVNHLQGNEVVAAG